MQKLVDIMNSYFKEDICSLENYGRCIRVNSHNINMWIRLYETSGVVIDFSTIEIDESLQRTGIFSGLFEVLDDLDFIREIRVTSVCTEAMDNWCKKHQFEKVGYCNYVWRKF